MSSTLLARIAVAVLLFASHAAAFAAPVEVLKEQDCFAGFETYEKWMTYIREHNGPVAYLSIRWKFPAETYTHYQRTLDCRVIVYRSDGHRVMGYVVTPKAQAGARDRLPVIVYNRGGNGNFGALGFGDLFNQVFPLADRGYVVLASQYRGVPGAPEEQRSPDEYGGDDVDDVVAMVRMVPQLPRADADNVYMLGHSRGAIMTFRALLDARVKVRAVAIWSGVFDLHELLRFRPEFVRLYRELMPDYARDPKAALDRRSVVRWPERLPAATGILIFHGGDDERAPVSGARAFAAQLRELDRPHRLEVLEGESHFLAGRRDYVQAQTDAWFRQFRKLPHGDSNPSANNTELQPSAKSASYAARSAAVTSGRPSAPSE